MAPARMGSAKAMRQKLENTGVAPSEPIHLTNKPLPPHSTPEKKMSRNPACSLESFLFMHPP